MFTIQITRTDSIPTTRRGKRKLRRLERRAKRLARKLERVLNG
jgi:hypothetical protein